MSTLVYVLKLGDADPRVVTQCGDYEDWILSSVGRHRGARQGCLGPGQGAAAIRSGFDVQVWDLRRGEPPDEVPGAVILTGSRASVLESQSWMVRTMGYVDRLAEQGVPILGICFAHQLIVLHHGGRVCRNRLGWEMGSSIVTLTPEGQRDPIFEGAPTHFVAQQSHRDVVVEPPLNSRVLATSPRDSFHALRIRDRIWTCQFHPEMDAVEMRAVLAEMEKDLLQEGVEKGGLCPGDFSRKIADGIGNSPEGNAILDRFLSLARDCASLS